MNVREAVRAYFDVISEQGNEWIIRCPSPDHHDRRPSASVNVSKGLWCCYSCGAAGSVSRTLDGINIFFAESLTDQLDELDELLLEDVEPNYYSESWLDQFDYGSTYVHPYWQERGFSDDIVASYRLGYDYEHNCVTYPMRDPLGRVLGVVRRSLSGDGPKYRYPSGVEKSRLLFNYENIHSQGNVTIVEGALDALALADAGIDAVAIYGSKIHEQQIVLLNALPCFSLTLCFDNDAAGREATKTFSECGVRQLLRVVVLPESYNDIAEVPRERRAELINTAEYLF